MIAIALALMLAGQTEPEVDEPAVPAQASSAAPADDEEICRRITVPSPKSAGGKKSSKVCKTKDEWKDFAARRN